MILPASAAAPRSQTPARSRSTAKRCGDDRRDVQAGLDHRRHHVPGLVHLAAVDALDREHVEDDPVPVDGDPLGRDAQQAIRPPCAMFVEHARRTRSALPDISRPTSKPSSMPSSRWTSATRSARTSSARVAPILQASSRRSRVDVGDDDVAGAGVADDGRGHQPDRPGAGDEDVLAQHRERQRRVHGVAERVEDRGDVEVDPGVCCQTFVIGSAMYSANAPGALDADAVRVRAQMPPARHAVAAAPADEVALAADQRPHLEIAHVRADLDDLADELMADHESDRHCPRRPCVPGVDVHIGAADPRPQHPDQHVVDPDLRLRQLL